MTGDFSVSMKRTQSGPAVELPESLHLKMTLDAVDLVTHRHPERSRSERLSQI